ncbi:uncharacterized protein LOC111830223 [Capsella rubella]|uniref:uncharacterized protein LOC111830223 n=1 Tax=Capsella rubella TaxID=81985 RepID=UPI000CD50B24|nr:uncharacterized protein LOC111830223 [Capsella rubella]
MGMKKLFKVLVFFLFGYLTCSMAMVPYRGCDVIGLGKSQKRVVNKEGLWSGRRLVSGPSRSACGH